MPKAITILLDDCASSPANPSSRLLRAPVDHWTANQKEDIELTLAAIERARNDGLTVIALFSYELGEHLQQMNARKSRVPLVEAFGFDQQECLSERQVSEWIESQLKDRKSHTNPAGLMNIDLAITRDHYAANVAAIQQHIADGQTYQVNHTFKIMGTAFGDPLALYRDLRVRQPVRYGAYIDTGSRKVLSFSPELFLECIDGLITAKPMKGTRQSSQGDAKKLSLSAKDRAENLMITDLIRNDLGQICKTGSIKVPKLFEVEKVGSLYQMTSTVTGSIKDELSLYDLLCATFPCGSITGAPKRHTMGIIQALEPGPRNLYCGSIACLDPHNAFQMNVAIRTLELNADGSFEMGVGSGITADSDPNAEWEECMAKAAFVTSLPSPVGLIETMRAEGTKIDLLHEHLQRLQKSAKALRIPCDLSAIENQISLALAALPDLPHVLRLELSPEGELTIKTNALSEISEPQKIFWANDLLGKQHTQMKSSDPLLAHKTTHRAVYDAGWKAAVDKSGFDAVFINERGEVTEGGRSSIFAFIDGQWKTPALSCGVLPGVMRSKLLADRNWNAQEAVLYPGDIISAERVILVNALRGVIDTDRSGLGPMPL